MKKKIGSTLLPLVSALFCEILLIYEHNDAALLLLAGALLLLSNLSLLFHAMETKSYGAFAMCLFSSGLILWGKFVVPSEWHITVGIFGLFLSAALNLFQGSES